MRIFTGVQKPWKLVDVPRAYLQAVIYVDGYPGRGALSR
jgi:hypothetical protein